MTSSPEKIESHSNNRYLRMLHPSTLRNLYRSQRLLKNFLFVSVGNVLSKAILFLVNAYLARVFAPELYGEIVLAQTALLFGTMLADLGVRTLAVRNIAVSPQGQKETVINRSWATVFWLGIAAIVLSLLGTALIGGSEQRMLVFLYVALLPLFTLNWDWVLKGEQRFPEVGVAEILKAAFYFGALLLLVKSPADLYLVPIAYGTGLFTSAAFVAARVRPKRMGIFSSLDRVGTRPLLWAALPIGIAGIMTQFCLNGGVLFVGYFGDSAEVGIYAAVLKLTFLVMMLGAVFSETLLPAMSERQARSDAAGWAFARQVFFVLGLAGICIVVFTFMFADQIIALIYGSRYIGAAPVLRVSILMVIPFFLGIPLVNLLIARGAQRSMLYAMAGGTILNLAGQFLLTQQFGPLGAAWTDFITQATVTVLLYYFVYKTKAQAMA